MVYPQAAYLLREHLLATNWSLDNHYHALTLSSRNLLDFPIPPGLHLALSHRPTSQLASNLQLSTLVPAGGCEPHDLCSSKCARAQCAFESTAQWDSWATFSAQLHWVIRVPRGRGHPSEMEAGTSTKQRLAMTTGRGFRFRDAVQSFQVCDLPQRPELRDDAKPTWLAGTRVDKSDFLMYGRIYAPSPRLDALYAHRLSPTLLTLVSLISVPSPIAPPQLSWQPNDESSSLTVPVPPASTTSARLSELEIKLQQDTGRWSTEYSYAVGDGMWGARGLYNFSHSGSTTSNPSSPSTSTTTTTTTTTTTDTRERVVDEEEAMSTGLKGRWSAGGEVYLSAQERSAGVSTGIRFVTLPPEADSSNQPPTVMTATLNPFMGQLSMAYAVQTSRLAALASRFDFNTYSYEAELTVGGEWFQTRRHRAKIREGGGEEKREQRLKTWDAFGRGMASGTAGDEADSNKRRTRRKDDDDDEVIGVVKARASTNSDIALMWEGRVGDFLVSLGLVADLRLATKSAGRVSPIRSVGLGVQYWG